MNEFWVLILVSFFAKNSLDKAESVKLDENPYKIIDEIFGEGWWDNDKAEEWDKLTLEQIGPDSTDQNPPLTHFGQIEPNPTDQNPPLIESDHSDNAKNDEEITSNENIAEDERKRKIIDKFHAIKDEFEKNEKYSKKEWAQIENEIAKDLKVNRKKIYEWKKEFGLSRKMFKEKEKRKHLIEKFDQKKADLKRDGFKNSYPNEINETVAKELGLNFKTIYRWKQKLGQTKSNKHSHSEQKDLMKRYYEIKNKNPKIRDADIVKMLKIGSATLARWKKQTKRQQLHTKSVDGHSVEENARSNGQEIGNPNSGSTFKPDPNRSEYKTANPNY